MMTIFKRWAQNEPAPTAEELAGAESFKQILKYGEDIGGLYKDICARQDAIYKEKREIKKVAEKAIVKQRGLKFKRAVMDGNWNDIYIRDYAGDCNTSPLGVCVTMIEYGSNNPNDDDKQYCFYCNREFG